MLTKKLVAVLAGLVVLGFVVSAGGDDEKKEHKAILNAVNRVNGALGGILATEQGILANLGHLLTGLDDIVVKLDGLFTQGEGIDLCAAPDLVPLPLPGSTDPTGFCRIDVGPPVRLHVLVHNQGGKPAGPSQTRVMFRVTPDVAVQIPCVASFQPSTAKCAERDVPTQGLGGFLETNVVMDIPDGCFGFFGADDRNCKFKIAVDANDDVKESNEVNNNAAGECIAGIL